MRSDKPDNPTLEEELRRRDRETYRNIMRWIVVGLLVGAFGYLLGGWEVASDGIAMVVMLGCGISLLADAIADRMNRF